MIEVGHNSWPNVMALLGGELQLPWPLNQVFHPLIISSHLCLHQLRGALKLNLSKNLVFRPN